LKVSRCGDLRRSTLSWWRSVKISACSDARDRNNPISANRCVGDRLAEQQLRILWEEILQREFRFKIVGPPQRLYSNFIRGIRALPVRIIS
jgi:hypothetical protein